MAIQTIRSEAEIIARFDRLTVEGREETETDEYLRQIRNGDEGIDDYLCIDRTAKSYLSYMLRNIGRARWLQVRQAVRQYVAWKWMLGHEDADRFPGADGQQLDLRIPYLYLRDQIQSGEWDRMTMDGLQRALDHPVIAQIKSASGEARPLINNKSERGSRKDLCA